MKKALIACSLAIVALSEAPAQRVSDGRVAMFVRHEADNARRVKLSVGRLVLGGLLGGLVGGTALLATYESESESLAVAAVGAYLVATAAGATLIESYSCDPGKRFRRALLGSVAGAAVAIGTASALRGQKNGPAVVAGVVGFLGTPLGAAVALWQCD